MGCYVRREDPRLTALSAEFHGSVCWIERLPRLNGVARHPVPFPPSTMTFSASLEGRRSYADYADGHLVCGDIRAGKAAATTAAKLVSRT
jgi:hypothetical protein